MNTLLEEDFIRPNACELPKAKKKYQNILMN